MGGIARTGQKALVPQIVEGKRLKQVSCKCQQAFIWFSFCCHFPWFSANTNLWPLAVLCYSFDEYFQWGCTYKLENVSFFKEYFIKWPFFVSTIYLDKNDFNSFERQNLINAASSWEVCTDSRKSGQICPMPRTLPAGMDASFDKYLLKNNMCREQYVQNYYLSLTVSILRKVDNNVFGSFEFSREL